MRVSTQQETESSELSLFGLLAFLALTALLLAATRTVHYLLFHTLAEIAAITVGFSIFTLTWASRRHLTNGYLIVLGAAYATIGVVDIFHTLTFKGMNLLPGVTSNHPTQFWLIARFIEALALLMAPLFARRLPNFDRMTLGFALLGTLGVMAVLTGTLPPTFEDGVGLTRFKIIAEYAIVIILLLGLWLLWRIRYQFPALVFRLLSGSVILAIATEICFIHYVSFYDLINELGHYFRFLSVVVAYLALVVTGVRRPAELLYRQLAEKEQELALANARLAESSEQLKQAQSVAGVGSWHLDIAEQALTWSDETYRIFDMPHGAPVTLASFSARIHPDDVEQVFAAWQATLNGAAYDIEHRIVLGEAKPQVRWVRERADLARNAQGEAMGGIGTVQDITEQKLASLALAESEARYRTLYEATPTMLHSIDAAGCLISVSQYWLDTLGYTRDEVIGRKSTDFMSEESRQRAIAEVLPEFYRLGQVSNVPYEMLSKDGRIIDVLLSGTGERDAAGKIVRSLAVLQNVTEQKAAERKVTELLKFNQQIIEQSSTGIAVFAAEGQCVLANEALATSLGAPLADVLAQNFFTIASWRPSGLFDAALEALEQQRIIHRNVDLLTGFGHEVALACSFTTASLGGKLHLVVLANDISHFRRSEKVLQEARLVAESANSAKSLFLANMSHEIRTPMNAIIGLTELVLESSLEEKQRSYLQKVQKSSRALLGILNDILDYSKIESGRLELDAIEFCLENSLKNTVDLFSVQIAEKGIELSIDTDPALPAHLLGDPLRLEQVLNNLLSNAVKFTASGEIRLHAELLSQSSEQACVRISVHDTGIGLSEPQAARLFQPFAQADASITRKFGGTGLGLAISKRLVRLMGGEISVASTLGHGSCFTFTACFAAGTSGLREQSLQRQGQMQREPQAATESRRVKIGKIAAAADAGSDTDTDTGVAALFRQVEPLLAQLAQQLEAKSFSARQVAAEIENQLRGSRLQDGFGPIGRAVKALNYEAARAHLRQFVDANSRRLDKRSASTDSC